MEASGVRLTLRQKAILASLCLAVFMIRLDGMIVNISLPTLSRELHAPTGQVFWIVLSYLLIQTSTLLLFGKLGERAGLPKVFIAGFSLFTAASLGCGLAPDLRVLVASRFLQGLGGAMMLVTAYAIIPRHIPKEFSGFAFALLAASVGAGVAVGAPLGGIITGYLSWRWIFLVNLPFGGAAILIAALSLPRERRPAFSAPAGHFDLTGAVSSFAGLLLLIYGLNMGEEHGWRSPPILASLAASAFLLVFFALWELRHRAPMLDLRMFKDMDLTSACAACLLVYAAISANSTMFPFYLELSRGLKVQTAGFVVLIFSVVFIPASVLLGKITEGGTPRFLPAAGIGSAAASALVFFLQMGMPGLAAPILFLIWLAIALAVFLPLNNGQVVTLAPATHGGEASGVLGTMQNLGMTLGACIAEALFSATLSRGPAGGPWNPGQAANHEALLEGFSSVYGCFLILLLTATIVIVLDLGRSMRTPRRRG